MAGKKILIVDDQDVELRSLETVLRKTGYDTITATSAEIALEVLEKAEGVDLVVTDVCMGELSGIDLVSLLPNNMPALVMTGHPNEHDLVHLKREGVVDYIEKPCAPEHLLSLLDSIFQTQKTYCDLERKVMVSTPCDHDFEKVCGDFDHTFLDYVPIILRADSVQDTAIKMYEYSPGIVILTEKTSPEDACKIVRRVSSTYPFTNIISLGSVLTRGETGRYSSVRAMINKLYGVVPCVSGVVDEMMFFDNVQNAFFDRRDRINQVLRAKKQSRIIILTGPRASGKTMTAKGVASSLHGLIELGPRDVERKPRPGEVDSEDHRFKPEGYITAHSEEYISTFTHKDDNIGYAVGLLKEDCFSTLRRGLDWLTIVASPQEVLRVADDLMKTNFPVSIIGLMNDKLSLRIRAMARDSGTSYLEVFDGQFLDFYRTNSGAVDMIVTTQAVRTKESDLPLDRYACLEDVENTVRKISLGILNDILLYR